MAALLLRSSSRLVHLPELITLQRASLSVSSRFFADRKFTKKHEWVLVENGVGTVGITAFAAGALGDIVYVDLPEVGKQVAQGDSFCAVESVKAASDVYTPVSGTITERNEALEGAPNMINKSPLDEGWICKVKLTEESELKGLLTEAEYNTFKEQEEAAH
ncbi:unnamed protein product, partial [Mesorhabditis belari]|uniref:Glycine cleavage system H protein n=1 Tax=Mesorhabditis belari TaxID=2138241 RepID=A0AAF3FEL9_9BILA